MYKIIVFAGMILFSIVNLCFSQEEIEITTYYPSPVGVYKNLTTTEDTNLATTTGKVGIGTSEPNTALDVNGAVSARGMAAPAVSVAGQGRIYFDSTANKFKVSENTGAYADLVGGGGWAVPTDVKVTSATHNGNFGGYAAMNTWIQTNGCSGYHVCDNVELTRWLQSGGATPSAIAWYNAGLRTASSGTMVECYGWTDAVSYTGSVWHTANFPSVSACSASYAVACCN